MASNLPVVQVIETPPQGSGPIVLARDCEATRIPSGADAVLPAGTLVEGRLHGDLLAAAQDDRPHRLARLDRVQHEHQVLDAGDVVLAEPDEDVAPAHASEVGGPAGADVCQQHAAL